MIHPGNDVAPESGYRPPPAADMFVRCRDMTCRFPNCDRPDEFCNVDHTVPDPVGLTHSSKLKCFMQQTRPVEAFRRAPA